MPHLYQYRQQSTEQSVQHPFPVEMMLRACFKIYGGGNVQKVPAHYSEKIQEDFMSEKIPFLQNVGDIQTYRSGKTENEQQSQQLLPAGN